MENRIKIKVVIPDDLDFSEDFSDLYKFVYKPIEDVEDEFNSTPYVESVTPVLTGLQRIERNPKLIHLSTLLEESRLTMDKCEFLGGRINYMYYRMLCQEVMREILYIIENEIKILSFFPRFEPSDYEKNGLSLTGL